MSANISEILKQVDVGSRQQENKNVIIVVDNSGSTGGKFANNGTNILEKEMMCVLQYILESYNEGDNYYFYTFSDDAKYYGGINILIDEQLVNLPTINIEGSTYTHKAFEHILKNIKLFKQNITVKLFTDGQTNSSENILKQLSNDFKTKNIKLEVVAVTNDYKNMETITTNEEQHIPGMDLINYLGNNVDKLEIYNTYHKDLPYLAAIHSRNDKHNIVFMGLGLNISIIRFFNNLIPMLETNKDFINWGPNDIDYKKMLSEIGKLWSLLIIEFNEKHPFIDNISNKLFLINPSISKERIIKIINYGFNCSKNKKPIILTNFEQHVKEKTIKHNEFKNALSMLDDYGSTLNCQKIISLPFNGLCLISPENNDLTKKSSKICYDAFNNPYIGIDANDQAIRIALRNYAAEIGFPNARSSPDVIFLISSQMLLLAIKGHDLYCEHMNELRKIAIAQTSMEGMIGKNQYDGVGFYAQWKVGTLPRMHYSNSITHTSLYTNKKINPLLLSETIWWASMMLMLDIYDEQLDNYKTSVEALCNDSNKNVFLTYLKNTYESSITGNVIFEKINQKQISMFTQCEFEPQDELYLFTNHGECRANTLYTKQECEAYVSRNGCIWCYHIPSPDELIPYENKQLVVDHTLMLKTSPLKCSNVFEVANLSTTLSVLSVNDNSNKIRIDLVGITGSGKSTIALQMKTIIENNGGRALIVNADKHSKKGLSGKNLGNAINKEILNFDKQHRNGKSVIIIDLCNENGYQNVVFKYDFENNGYKTITFYPNMNKDMFDDYEAWCLNNVLSRPIFTDQTTYWLNPISAGINTCVRVHSMKTQKIRQMLGLPPSPYNFSESDSHEKIIQQTLNNVERYNSYLSVNGDDVTKFMQSCGF